MTARYDRDPWTLTLDERFDAVRDSDREIARIQARQARLMAAIVDDPCTGSPAPKVEKEYVRDQLRATLGQSAVAVGARIELARALVHRLPQALDALEAGQLTLRHARLLCDAVTALPPDSASAVETKCVPFAVGRDLTAFARKVRREVLALDHHTNEDQLLARALQQRRVWTRPDDYNPALASFGALLPADGAQALLTALDVAADRTTTDPDDTRTKDQRRADALVQFGIDALNRLHACPNCSSAPIVEPTDSPVADDGGSGTLPRRRGLRPAIHVSVALSTLLGLDNQPGDLDGHGPIPAALARHLAADPTGTWRRLITDPLGTLIDYGRTTYQPPTALRDHITARDRTCRFPTCHRPVRHGEIDHITAWAHGGPTNHTNLHGLCRRHHHLKHDTDWTVQRRPDGTTVWTTPTGTQHTIDPATYPIDHTTEIAVQNDNDTGSPDETDSPDQQAA